MGKQFYHADAVPNRYQDIVQRRSALYPLMGWPRQAKRKSNEPYTQFLWRDTVSKAMRLQELWYDRVRELAAAGWRYAHPIEPNVRFLQSCRPAFFIPKGAMTKEGAPTGKQYRRCQRPGCPYCYARQVMDLWDRLDSALFYDPRMFEACKAKVEPGGHLTCNTTCTVAFVEDWVHILPGHAKDADKAAAALQDELDRVLRRLIPEVFRRPRVLGGVNSVVVEPHKERGLVVRSRRIQIRNAVMDGDAKPRTTRDEKHRKVTIRFAVQPTRRQLMEETAKLLRYPTMLLRGDVQRAVQASHAAYYLDHNGQEKRHRMAAVYGRVYGQKNRKKST